MSTLIEIESAIERLPADEMEELRRWPFLRDWPKQDEDIAVPRSYQRKVLDALDKP